MFENADAVLKNKDEKLSEELSKIVKGVKIDVFLDSEGIMCSKKMADVKTILGPTSVNDLRGTLQRISNGLKYVPNILVLTNYYCAVIYFWFILIYHLIRPQMKSDFILNDDKKTFTVVGLDYIPIFVNKKLVTMLNHDELVSVCLSSVFDHTQYTREMFRKIFINSRWETPLNILKTFIIGLIADDFVEDFTGLPKKIFWTSWIIGIALGIIFINALNKILYVHNDIKSDHFVVVIGRKDSLISAYKKLKAEVDKYETTLSKLAKSAQKIVGLHLTNTSYETRIKNIEDSVPEDEPSKKMVEIDKNFVNVVNNADA